MIYIDRQEKYPKSEPPPPQPGIYTPPSLNPILFFAFFFLVCVLILVLACSDFENDKIYQHSKTKYQNTTLIDQIKSTETAL